MYGNVNKFSIGIIKQIDVATAASSRSVSVRSSIHGAALSASALSGHRRLMDWIELELSNELKEMDVLAKWLG